jgi:hypothetical protein
MSISKIRMSEKIRNPKFKSLDDAPTGNPGKAPCLNSIVRIAGVAGNAINTGVDSLPCSEFGEVKTEKSGAEK